MTTNSFFRTHKLVTACDRGTKQQFEFANAPFSDWLWHTVRPGALTLDSKLVLGLLVPNLFTSHPF